MRMNRRVILASSAAAMLMGTAPNAWALTEGDARTLVTATIDELVTLLKTAGTAASRAPALRQIMETRANMPLIARFSAGRAWRDMSDAQQQGFTKAFSKFVSVTYSRRFDEFSGDPQISVGRAINAGNKGVLIKTPFAQGADQPIEVEWLVSDRGGRVEIVDIVVEGISLAVTQREEIASMLQARNGDIDALISDLAAAG